MSKNGRNERKINQVIRSSSLLCKKYYGFLLMFFSFMYIHVLLQFLVNNMFQRKIAKVQPDGLPSLQMWF